MGACGLLIMGACAGSEDAPPPLPMDGPTTPSQTKNPLERALGEATGVEWFVDADASTNLAVFAKPAAAVAVGTTTAQLVDFVARFPAVFGVQKGEVDVLRDETDASGTRRVFLGQAFGAGRAPLRGTSVQVEVRGDGTLVFVAGHGLHEVRVDAPRSAAEAQSAAARATGLPPTAMGAPELVYLPFPIDVPSQAKAVYEVVAGGKLGAGRSIYVDASTLETVADVPALSSAEGSGVGASGYLHRFAVRQVGAAPSPITYEMYSPDGAYPGRVRAVDPDDQLITSADANKWVSDAAPERAGEAADGYGYTIAALKYYSARFKQKSFDDAGGEIRVTVHKPSSQYNAEGGYDGFGVPVIAFSDGKTDQPWKTLATAPDVVGHELSHLVGDAVVRRVKQTVLEARAVNEALADVLGNLFEASLGVGSPALVGDAAVPGGVRDVGNPANCNVDFQGPCPSDLDAPEMRSEDPHIISTIVSHAMYLASQGGTHAKSKIAISDPLTVAQAEDVYFATMKKCYRSGITFKSLAQCQIEQAKADKIPYHPIACAWAAVKVVSKDDVKSRYGVTCDGGVACEGKADGYYCAPDVVKRKATSYKCSGGNVASQDTCLACVELHSDRSKQNCSR